MSINDSFNRLKQQIFPANVIYIGENREILAAELEKYKKGFKESGITSHAMQDFMYKIAIVGELVKNGKVDIASVKQRLTAEHGSIDEKDFNNAYMEICDYVQTGGKHAVGGTGNKNFDQKLGNLAQEANEKLNIKVLVADDELQLLQLSVRILQSMGCTVETVKNGQELIDRLKKAQPGEFGLVITDNNMPVMNGIDALELIRTDDYLKSLNLPVIVNTSGSGEYEISKIALYKGIYLEKPWKPAQLKEIIIKVIKEHNT